MDLPWSGTFHSVGARLLRQHARQVGLRPSFTILDPSDAANLIDTIRSDLGFAKKLRSFPKKKTCLEIYSYMVNSQKSLKRTLTGQYQWCRGWLPQLEKLFAAYAKKKRRQNVVDFDDLLSFWLTLMNDKDTGAKIGGMFDHVLVDEYQDTNRLQAKILLKLKPDGRGLTTVGDDWQAIYSFRAATIRNILRFAKQFRPKARIIKLEQNYRSTQPILAACNAVIALSKEGYSKTLRSDRRSKVKPALIKVVDERAQASMIAQQIINARAQGTALKDQAVLFRDARHSTQLELELTRRKVPFRKFGGRKFLEGTPIKAVISVLRWCENPRDHLAGSRVLQLLPGIGSARATKMLDQLDGSLGEKALSRIAVPPTAVKDWAALRPVGPCRQDIQQAMAPCLGLGTESGANHICAGNTGAARRASPTWTSWSNSPKATPRVNGFWPSLAWIRRTRPMAATQRPARTTWCFQLFIRQKDESGRLSGF